MSAVSLVTYGAQANSGTSTPVDVSAHTVLRLDGRFACNVGHRVNLDLVIEHGRTSSGPWSTLGALRMQVGANWKDSERFIFSGFDNFVRVRWEATIPGVNLNPSERELRERSHPHKTDLAFGIAGEGTPDA